MNYGDYIACFSAGDDERLVEDFFCDDVVFRSSGRDFQGKAALKDFLDWAHDGVREVPRPQLVLQNRDHLFAEIDMDFHAVKERPDFPFGHLHAGDMMTVKFFVTYELRGGRVASLTSMVWPPEKGVSRVPRLGAMPTQIAAFHSYAAAFSAGDTERFTKFYTDDIVLELPAAPPIKGPDAIAEYYSAMFKRVRETITIHSLDATAEKVTLNATARFTAVKDAPDFVVAALSKGEFLESNVIVEYRLKDGLIDHIDVRRNGEKLTHGKIG
ncbi:nuclear transport factor 2 family protein [Hyphococcus luteus]|uniref:SnoaL-like domain-containing protein n=1 Tax=Hyphococcus luteus TaxID=2058213 RepID=A0A2S7JZH4_9PROT|nr:nuclear transport factor 2 family protein [Marinicaulis flavus]PQA85632.1 hypothetical protein CW354_22130 [Marinicaulis flavus]